MLEELQKRQVDIENIIIEPGGSTGLSVILNSGTDRAILTSLGLIPSLRASDVSDAILRQSRHLHVASYFLQDALRPGLPALFGRAHSLDMTTSLDTNYDPTGKWLGFDELLTATNIFFPNETEAKSLTHKMDITTAADSLRGKSEIVAIKLGAQGALGIHGAETVKVDSIPVPVADTVGAGDSFDAGFIYGYLHSWDLQRSLRLACVCGALSTRSPGGTTAQPTLEEALEYA